MSTWRDFYGIEPTVDPEAIRRWADDGHDLAVALNDLPLDGPVHPGTLHIRPGVVGICCPVMGAALTEVATDAESKAAQLDGLEQMADWGCTWAVLDVEP